jgi:hypothetical protein
MSLEITVELIARQPSEAKASIRALLAKIQHPQDLLSESPRNSPLPPRTEHPHAKPSRPMSHATRPPQVLSRGTPSMSGRSFLRAGVAFGIFPA